MKELLPAIQRWRGQGRDLALATVVRTVGSSPRQVGSRMVVSDSGEMAGSVSGGCVEGAVVEAALRILETRLPQLLHFGVSDEEAWAVGLSCGGAIHVLVEPMEREEGKDPVMGTLLEAVQDSRILAVATELPSGEGEEARSPTPEPEGHSIHRLVLSPQGNVLGGLSDPDLKETVLTELRTVLDGKASGVREIGGRRLFLERLEPEPRLVIIGAVHIAVVLARMAREVGFRVVIVDARDRFASPERFPEVDELILGWPQEILPRLELDDQSHVVVITHDEKLDNPALELALSSPAPYVGALGSRRTHARRLAALREAGVDEASLARIHAPIGLDIGARTPAEIALATLAEIVAVRNEAHK